MTDRYVPAPRSTPQAPTSNPPAAEWWRPLTHSWGIIGLIIFIGLVMSWIEFLAAPRIENVPLIPHLSPGGTRTTQVCVPHPEASARTA
jgi:hypothetical protein